MTCVLCARPLVGALRLSLNLILKERMFVIPVIVEETTAAEIHVLPCFSAADVGFSGKGVDPCGCPLNLCGLFAFPSSLLQEHRL